MKRAIYAGSFDPITFGHLSVVERSARLFDQVWVTVAVNPSKSPLFALAERLEMIQETTRAWPNVAAVATEGYVVELARELGVRYLVRGVRSSTDAQAELDLSRLNRELAPEVETVFVPAHPELSEVSSSQLKQLASAGADLSRHCPEPVARRLRDRFLHVA